MPYDPDRHHRRSLRLKGYDYSQAGAYFVTINIHQRRCLLGEVAGGKVHLSPAGNMVLALWEAMPTHYPGVDVDACVVMPNHIHGIIVLKTPVRAATEGRPDPEPPQANQPCPDDPRSPPEDGGQALGPAPTRLRLADIVGRFKSLKTRRYITGVKELGWPPFDGHFWQPNYHERILRDEHELNIRRHYIAENPQRWRKDRENPIGL
jgi:REP element-mobilizing transposase RayT